VCICIQAFEGAWAAACKQGASTVLVPPELEFLVGPISFSGPYCKPNIVFQVNYALSPKLDIKKTFPITFIAQTDKKR